MVQRVYLLYLLLLSFAGSSCCFESYYGTIDAKDGISWIQQSQPAPAGDDGKTRWFWNPKDPDIDPVRKAAADLVNDVQTPWKDPWNSGSCQVAAINLAAVGVQTTWAQVKISVLSIMASGTDTSSATEMNINGGAVFLGSLAVILYSPSSQFARDLAIASSLSSGLTPAFFHDKIPRPPAIAPQPQNQNPPTQPIGPPVMNLAAPSPPSPGDMDCYSTSSCSIGELCHVVEDQSGSDQGCTSSVAAMLGMAYNLASAFCLASPSLCTLSAPPASAPPAYLCACNCTHSSSLCCTADDGMVSPDSSQLSAMLSPQGGMCCDELTGKFETVPVGIDNLDDGGSFAKCRNEPMIGANNIGRIQYRKRRDAGDGRSMWLR